MALVTRVLMFSNEGFFEMSEASPQGSNRWFFRGWIALLILIAIPFALPFIGFGVITGCDYLDVAPDTVSICDNAILFGFIGFAWLPYVLFFSAISAAILFVIQLISKKKLNK